MLLDVLRKLCDASISSRTLSPLHHRHRQCLRSLYSQDFDVDITGPNCILPWTWQNNLQLQLLLPVGVPPHASSVFLLPLHFCFVCIWVFSVQCAFANILQYLLASALLHSTLGRVKILRILLQAPETVEVCKASTLIVVSLQAEPSPLGRSFRS